MSKSLKTRVLYGLRLAVALAPWIVAMYVFYWLDSSGTWTSDTPHRGKMSVVLLAAGMVASFLLHSFLSKRAER
jgi:hypothetical protein